MVLLIETLLPLIVFDVSLCVFLERFFELCAVIWL